MKQRPDEDHDLLCKLDDDEVRLKGEQLAEAEHAYNVAEAEKAAAMKVFTQRMDAARRAMQRLGEDVRYRTERRTVVCRWYTETDSSGREVWELRRTDTGELLQTQPVTAADRQLSLIQGGGKN